MTFPPWVHKRGRGSPASRVQRPAWVPQPPRGPETGAMDWGRPICVSGDPSVPEKLVADPRLYPTPREGPQNGSRPQPWPSNPQTARTWEEAPAVAQRPGPGQQAQGARCLPVPVLSSALKAVTASEKYPGGRVSLPRAAAAGAQSGGPRGRARAEGPGRALQGLPRPGCGRRGRAGSVRGRAARVSQSRGAGEPRKCPRSGSGRRPPHGPPRRR